MAQTLSPATRSRTVGRYALFEEIASGGMAAVHYGRLVGPVGFSRTVAIKALHAQYAKDADFIAMFLDEARLVSRIRHPNVVPTLDVVQEGPELLIVMEYVEGETLSRLLRTCRAEDQLAPLPIVATILVGVLHGLHAAHEATGANGSPLNIVHRDVSPQNILVGTDGVPRILDFGVAKATQRSQSTRDGQLKGKIGYMAPEQILSDTVDRRCDIFAAGVVLWEALAGRRLFDGETDVRVMQRILAADVPPSGCARPELDAICMRALSTEPGRRFPTARDMALAIEGVSGLAPASEVGAWVTRLADASIKARAAKVAEVESRSDVFIKRPDPKPEGESPTRSVSIEAVRVASPTSPKNRVALIGVGAVMLVGLGVGLTLALQHPAPVPAPVAPPSATSPSAPVAAQPPAAPPEPSATPQPVATASDVPATSAAPAKPAAPRAPTRSSPAAATKPRTADCSQPFTIDANGIRHVKAECL